MLQRALRSATSAVPRCCRTTLHTPATNLCRTHTRSLRAMSTNAHDVDPHAKRQQLQQDGGTTVAASAVVSSAAAAAAAPGPLARLAQGDRTRFLSQSYTIPFAPLTRPLSFDDASSWPKDPMEVFSQWSVTAQRCTTPAEQLPVSTPRCRCVRASADFP